MAEKKKSKFLTQEENDLIFSSIVPNESCLCLGVTKLFITRAPSHSQWIPSSVGVVCLVKSSDQDIYIIKLFQFDSKTFTVEEELYIEFNFTQSKPNFLVFEGKNHMVGLLFAETVEADQFSKYLKRSIKKIKRSYGTVHTFSKTPAPASAPAPTPAPTQQSKPLNFIKSMASTMGPAKNAKKGKKKPIQISDISTPSDFRHIQASNSSTIRGYSTVSGFDLNVCEHDWIKLFLMLRLKKRHVANPNIAKEIVNFVQQHGGIKKIVEAINETEIKKKLKKMKKPELGKNVKAADIKVQVQHPAGLSNEGSAEPVTKDDSTLQEPPSVYNSVGPTTPPPLPQKSSAPPPPPPPARRESISMPPPPPPSGGSSTIAASTAAVSPAGASDRGDLLSQISSGGFKLKKAELLSDDSDDQDDDSGIVGLLAKRLESMRLDTAISDDSEDSEDEWNE